MPESADKRKERRGGFYFVEGEPYPTVTTILNIKNKPALMRWGMTEVYWAMVSDPSLSLEKALAAPFAKTETAKTRGTSVHSIVESYKNGATLDSLLSGVPTELAGYARAFYRWVQDNDIEILQHERTVVSKKFRYAGTLDMLVKMKNSGKTVVVDVKTGKQIYPEAFLQLSAYKQALHEEGMDTDELAVLLLGEKGSYTFGSGQYDIDAFLHAKGLWEWNEKEVLDKVIKGKADKE